MAFLAVYHKRTVKIEQIAGDLIDWCNREKGVWQTILRFAEASVQGKRTLESQFGHHKNEHN